MTETWLLFDEAAIRRAAGNPNGRVALPMPVLTTLEQLAKPKSTLYTLIKQATGLSSHRRESFAVTSSAKKISQYVQDFSPLRALSAFAALEQDVRNTMHTQGWDA
ncbi:MAG: hypothetical protein HY670_04705 [Chloroflexi bacterium]|nr:hypothetical protein [Chloroflexota bacterium]